MRLEYGKLKRMAEAADGSLQPTAPTAFLDLMPQGIGPADCVIELEGPRGKMRGVFRSAPTLLVWRDQATSMEFPIAVSGAGQPGLGVYGTPAGNGFSDVQLGLIDRTAPSAIDGNQVGVSAFRNHVDVQWKPVADDANGIGLAGYWIYRDGLYQVANWGDAFALVPSIEAAYVWHASKFTREVLDGRMYNELIR